MIHGDVYRKGKNVPYVAHLLSVAALVLEDGGSEDKAIAASHYDALEDHSKRVSISPQGHQLDAGMVFQSDRWVQHAILH
jgi:ribulose-5-phosphate 4-epimerase/fuculose-1-phosphate aldolase